MIEGTTTTTTVSPVEISTLEEQLPATTPSRQVSSDFHFNAEHNGVECIESLRPEDRGTERQFWFTRQMLREIFDVKSDNTITNHVEALINRGVVEVVKNLTTLKIPTNGGVQETVLYDLKVFNYLVMRLDTDQAWEMKAKFNDVLVERETNSMKCLPQDYESALEALLASVRETKRLEAERDEAIRTKAMIGSKREATAMATASAKARECERLTTENDLLKQDFVTNVDFCSQLLAQNLVVYAESTLRGKCSKALQELTALMEKRTLDWKEWNEKAGKEVPRVAYHKDVCAELKQRIIDNPKYLKRF